MEFVTVDILTDKEGLERLLELGIRKVPVVANGAEYVFGQNLEAVAAFVGVRSTGHTPHSPEVLSRTWITVLRAAQRFVRQLPLDRMNERAIENRDRTIRILSHHLFRIAEAFLECAIDGIDYDAGLADVEPQPGTCNSGDEIAHYGDRVVERLQRWANERPDRSCEQSVQTFYGPQTVHELLERSVWHSAQHARQLAYVLERWGINPDGPLLEEDLAGLPLPNAIL